MTSILLSTLLIMAQSTGNLALTVIPAEPRQGELVVIEVSGVDAGTPVQGSFGQKRLRFFSDEFGRIRALAAVPAWKRPGKLPVVVKALRSNKKPVVWRIAVNVLKVEWEKDTLRVDPNFIKPPKKFFARIRQEKEELQKIWTAPCTQRQWQGNFVWPRNDELSSPFGVRRVFNGQVRSQHYGLDINGMEGDPVLAIGDGTVVMAADRYFSGKTVIIDHGLQLFSLYFHMSDLTVKPGEQVQKGQLVGKVGSTGRVTGPHLHLSTKIEGIPFDPRSLLEMRWDPNLPEDNP